MIINLTKSFLRCRRGNVAMIFALVSIPLFGAAGLALDYSRAIGDRTRLQNAVDGAVLAGAGAPQGQEVATANQFFNAALLQNPVEGATASFSYNTSTGVSGTAGAQVPSTLLKILHVDDIAVDVAARALRGKSGSGGPVCILLVDPTATQSLLANSGATISAPCEIHVRSTANPAAIFNGGTDLAVQKICVKGAKVIINGSAKPPVETSCAAIDDPYAGKLPVVTVPTNCTHSGTNYNANGADVTLPLGNHCNVNINGARNVYMKPGMFQSLNFNGSPIINMEAGLYIFKNTTIINSGATVNGTGVTLYFADSNSKIQFNGNVTLKLKAPADGNYAGILFMEPSGLSKTQLVFNNTNNTVLEGLFYLPSRNVTINSVSNITGDKISMVFNTLILNGTGWKFQPSEKMSMSSASDTQIVLTK